ncbi:MAG TPA: tetratricopeptide repeat protein [Thermoanaerobaculia bacterium]|nr:tetratricopeptide repeat protein [Thermoanaerobaculia bacterium]
MIIALLAASPALAITGAPERDKTKERERTRTEARVDREAELYDQGTGALDEKDWSGAVRAFRRVAQMKGEHADGALYWLAMAQKELGQSAEALASLIELRKAFPSSHWTEDGNALEVEIRQSSGQHVEPDQLADDDVKLMAINGLMFTDSEKALPILEKIIIGNGSSRMKERAIFIVSQSHSPRAIEVIGRAARDNAHRDVQGQAIKFLGIMGDDSSRKLLADVYSTTSDVTIKRNILRSYMIGQDRDRLLVVAKTEPNLDLRGEAVRQLGIIGARGELADLYQKELAVPIRKQIIQAMFIGGNAEKLAEIARTEKDPQLRATAVRNIGFLGKKNTGDLLVSLYDNDSSAEVKRAVIMSLFVQQNGKALVSLARKEKDPALKREIVSKLSLVHSDDVTDYLMEVLKE